MQRPQEPNRDPETSLRVLVLAPTARDAAASRAVLTSVGVEAHACGSTSELCGEAQAGAAVLLLAEEALTPRGLADLLALVERQPPWSDLPILLFARSGTDSPQASLALDRLGNVTLLDRPARIATLVSAVKTALRSRERQYLLREHVAEQARAQAALREADRRKDEFLAMLAHELRNPLASIVAAAAVQGATADLEVIRRQQAIIARQAGHTARLLDDLLDVSRITQGRIELRLQPVDLVAAVAEVAAACRPAIEARGHRFSIALPEEPLVVEADAARLEQIVSNLLTNAAKYTDPGGSVWLTVEATSNPTMERGSDGERERLVSEDESHLSATIEGRSDGEIERLVSEDGSRSSRAIEGMRDRGIERPIEPGVSPSLHPSITPSPPREGAVLDTPVPLSLYPSLTPSFPPEASPSWAIVRVRDTGIGIAPELLPRVFDLFTQAERSLARSEGGVGIGLTMVRRLVEMHGGAVEARSDGPDHGSEFIVRLPLRQGSEGQGIPVLGYSGVRDVSPPEYLNTPIPEYPLRSPVRVLIVEDNPDVAETMAELLELWGYRVRVAANGGEALRVAREFAADVFLMDLGLPDLDGYEVAARLRESGLLAGARLVALSGYGQADDRQRTADAGFHHHLTKPVDPEDLRALLTSATAARRE